MYLCIQGKHMSLLATLIFLGRFWSWEVLGGVKESQKRYFADKPCNCDQAERIEIKTTFKLRVTAVFFYFIMFHILWSKALKEKLLTGFGVTPKIVLPKEAQKFLSLFKSLTQAWDPSLDKNQKFPASLKSAFWARYRISRNFRRMFWFMTTYWGAIKLLVVYFCVVSKCKRALFRFFVFWIAS